MDLLPPEVSEALAEFAVPALSLIIGFVGLIVFCATSGGSEKTTATYDVKELYIYPVASCMGIKVQRLALGSNTADATRYVIIKDKAAISLDDGNESLRISPVMGKEGVIALEARQIEPLVLSNCQRAKETTFRFDGRNWRMAPLDGSQRWLGEVLGGREDDYCLHELIATSKETASPLSIVHEASLESTRSRCEMVTDEYFEHRFRPNVIVTGGKPFEEDLWKQLDFVSRKGWCAGKSMPYVVSMLQRYTVAVNRCPDNNSSQQDLLASLRKWRMTKGGGMPCGPFFGVDVKLDCPMEAVQGAVINVGDAVTVNEWFNTHPLQSSDVAKMYGR